MLSVALRVKTISLLSFALMNFAAFSRAFSKSAVAISERV